MPVENPLAILTFIAAPAILTNAASLLVQGTSNRFGRTIDRTRTIIKMLEAKSADEQEVALYRQLLTWMERRTVLLLRAIWFFSFSIGCFAAGSLLALLIAALMAAAHPLLLRAMLGLALLAGAGGLGSMVIGGMLLVRETRLGLLTISEETRFYRMRYLGGE
jgi:hypothetical protein